MHISTAASLWLVWRPWARRGWRPDRVASVLQPRQVVDAATKLTTVKSALSTPGVTPTSYKDITSYNNFYEFGVEKDNPAQNAGRMKTRPWTVTVDGLVKQKKTVSIDELLSFKPTEERVYRHRCVEAWSMVIPWAGYSLSELIQWAEPLPKAKYVEFVTLEDRGVMPGLSEINLNWPYTEGLRMDEAMHPLTLLAFGLYGEVLPNQDGGAGAFGGALEIRVQVDQVHCQNSFHCRRAAHRVEWHGTRGIRLLLQRQPERRSSALEPEIRAPHWRVALRSAAAHAYVQWLRRPGRQSLQRHGLEEVLLTGRVTHP